MGKASVLASASAMGLLLLGATGFALADVNSGSSDIAAQLTDRLQTREDSISQRDRDVWSRLNIESRFGVGFRSHMPVCNTTATDEAHCDARVVTDANLKPLASPRVIFGYSPAQFHDAYSTATSSATKQIIAVVDAYDHPYIQSDLDTYSSAFGIARLPACSGSIANVAAPCFKKVDQRGGARYPRANSGWSLEIALDVEMAHAMCQNCSILLVEADSSSYTNLMAAVDRAVALGANVVSNSYGSNEFSGETSYDYHFNRSGVAFTVASGDSGYGAEYPASSRYVTAVGGTRLFFNPLDGSYDHEEAWAGGGSGCSAFESQPSWQTALNLGGCSKRIVADVSADADPNTGAAVYDSVPYFGQSGWWEVGGTSLSSPIIAGVYALSGKTSGNADQLPYTLGNASNLHDIVRGSNGSCGGSYLCTSLPNYDGPTGLGSPKGTSAF